jgi:hypothetical protein
MKIPIHHSELSSLVARLNFEIQEQIIESMTKTTGPAYVFSWNKFGEEDCLEICCDTKMVEVRSIVVPVDIIDSMTLAIPLSGSRLEAVGAWRVDRDQPWLRNHCFGDAGTLVLSLRCFEPEHINTAASMLAETISKYLDVLLETC